MTTVGYGDVVPKLPLSKTIGALCALTGVLILAVIIPVFVNNFLLFYSYSKLWKHDENERKLSAPANKERSCVGYVSGGKIAPKTISDEVDDNCTKPCPNDVHHMVNL